MFFLWNSADGEWLFFENEVPRVLDLFQHTYTHKHTHTVSHFMLIGNSNNGVILFKLIPRPYFAFLFSYFTLILYSCLYSYYVSLF